MITKFYYLMEKKQEDFAGGLAEGFALGLMGGIIIGGAIGGLMNLSSLIRLDPINIIALIALTIIIAETLYGFNNKERNTTLKKVVWLKTDSILTAVILIINALNINWAIYNLW